ncbi:MAG: DUF1572 family protein [Acidobacteriota bacterium]
MNIEYLHRVISRDASTLSDELTAYPLESQIWEMPPGIKNAAGTLVLHLCGNLRHFVGAQFGGTRYVRERDLEFSRRDVSRADLLAECDAARHAVAQGFATLTDGDLGKPFPVQLAGETLPTGLALLHMATHLSYHLGQIDYHRRLVTGQCGEVKALPVPVSSSPRQRVG